MNTTITSSAARRTVRTLGLTALAAPIAAAITVGASTAAHADDQPVLAQIVLASSGGGLNPDLPAGPGELTGDQSCLELQTCGGGGGEDPEGTLNPDLPAGPGDLVVETPCWQTDTCPPVDPDDEGTLNPDIPEGPGDFEVETPCWQTDTCPPVDPGDEDGDDEGDDGDVGGDDEGDESGQTGTHPDNGDDGIDKPTRIDAGAATADGGLDLAWALPGGLLVTATGLAFAARRTRTSRQG
jgi:hypothetical protein